MLKAVNFKTLILYFVRHQLFYPSPLVIILVQFLAGTSSWCTAARLTRCRRLWSWALWAFGSAWLGGPHPACLSKKSCVGLVGSLGKKGHLGSVSWEGALTGSIMLILLWQMRTICTPNHYHNLFITFPLSGLRKRDNNTTSSASHTQYIKLVILF